MSFIFEDDSIQELLFQIDSNQFSQTDRDAYIQFDDIEYGFTAPIVNGGSYLSVERGTLPAGGIPLTIFESAFNNGDIQFFSTLYDPVGRELYDAPILIWYRTLGDYSFAYPYNNDVYAEYSDYWYPYLYNYYPIHFAYSRINSKSYYPVHRRNYFKFPRRSRLPINGSHARYSIGNFVNRRPVMSPTNSYGHSSIRTTRMSGGGGGRGGMGGTGGGRGGGPGGRGGGGGGGGGRMSGGGGGKKR